VAGTRWQVRGGRYEVARREVARREVAHSLQRWRVVQAQRESENSIARGSWLSSCSLCMF